MPGVPAAANTALITNGTTVTAQGDQGDGISVTSRFNVLNVNQLTGAIQPAAGTIGVNFLNQAGGNVTLNAGVAQTNIVIGTTGNQADGVLNIAS